MLTPAICVIAALNVARAEEVLLAKSPVRIVTSSELTMFPESWQKSPIHASGQRLPEEEFDRARVILDRALRKYPAQVLEKHLATIYVLAELKYSGISAAGTNSRTCVYVKMGDSRRGFTDAAVEGVFHAEFSSILLRNREADFDKQAWQAVNPPEFRYLGNGVDAIKQKVAGLALDKALHEQGFLKQYSQSTMENDFNAFAAFLFSGDASRWKATDEYPKLSLKRKLAVDFYQKLDPQFTEAYFSSLVTPQ